METAHLSPEGTAVLLATAWIIMHSKSAAFRKLEKAAMRRAFRIAWALLLSGWSALPRPPSGGLRATEEEKRLIAALDPENWARSAAARGLAGTLTGKPKLSTSGIECAVRLDGSWTVKKLIAAEDNVRALLGVKAKHRIDIRAGSTGGWAQLAVRTRSAADGDDLKWVPGSSFGIDTITGSDVRIPLGQRMLIAGRSGSGKSWSARPLLFDASEGPTNALVIIDLKKVEGRLWEHRARVASTPGDVVDVVGELVAEMTERLDLIPRGADTLVPTAERPRITVFVDEGAEVMSAAKDALAGLESIARMGRAPIVDLWWATQKPTMSGSSAGIPPQIAPQLSTVVCLSVRTPTETRTVLGEDAQAKGWNADELPAPGFALVRTDNPSDKPNPVRTRALSPTDVVALPSSRVWSRSSVSFRKDVSVPAVSDDPALVVSPVSGSTEGVPEDLLSAVFGLSDADRTLSVHDRVLSVLKESGSAVGAVEVSRAAGVPSSSAHRALRSLVDSGSVVQDDNRKYRVADSGDSVF